MMATDTRSEVIAAYRARRSVLLDEASEAERQRRPIAAAKKRAAARLISKAISDEVVDDVPTGIGVFDDWGER